MINASVIIKDSKVVSIEMTKDGVPCPDYFNNLLLLRNLVNNSVDNFEKDMQSRFLEEAKNAKPYEDPELPK